MRLRIAALLCVALVALAGCSSGLLPGGPSGAPTDDPTTAPTATPTTAPATSEKPWPRHAYPSPPPNTSTEAVTAVALEYESDRVHNRLRNDSDVTTLDVGYAYPSDTTVLNRSDDGAYVAVELRYSYGTEDYVADGASSRALYHVNESAIRRVATLDEYPPAWVGGPPGVTAENVLLAPGETATVTVAARNVSGMTLWRPTGGNVTFDEANLTPTPSPDVVLQSYPPQWRWRAVESSVTLTVPVRATANATPGTYRYAVSVGNASEAEASGTVAVTVTNGTAAA
jgi:hypothetical protein